MAAERQGSRWLYATPSEEELREWFKGQTLHEGLEHDPYMGGIVVIGAKEKYSKTLERPNGSTYVQDGQERMVYVPYVKVDTRIAYFWDLVRNLNGGSILGDYVGVISPVPQNRIEDPNSAYFNLHLPEGFFRLAVQNRDATFTSYIGCTQRVAIYERESYYRSPEDAVPLLQGIGSKQTLTGKTWADDNALMKAETSAVGRALGMAGILVVGTGVASAEDMQEVQAGEGGSNAAGREPSLPPVVGPQVERGQVAPPSGAPADTAPVTPEQEREALIGRITELTAELRSVDQVQFQLTADWAKESTNGIPVARLPTPALKGMVIKVERDLDAAKQKAERDLEAAKQKAEAPS